MEKILQAFSDIANVLPRIDKLRAVFQQDQDFNQVLALIYSDILEFHRRAYKLFRRRAWQVWFALNWGLFERRFESILTRLSLHCDALDKEAAATHFAEMKKYRDQQRDEIEAFEQRRQNQMTREVLEWLGEAEDYQEEYLHKISDFRQPGTCNWILEDFQMKRWIEEDFESGRLWITGIPGAGKSFLCSLVSQHLQTRDDRSTLYYFCGCHYSGPVTCLKVLRTLAVQLLRQNLETAPLVHVGFLEKIMPKSAPAIKKMLIQVLPIVKSAYIVLDGIDEFEHGLQEEVLKSLLDIQKSAEHRCKFLAFSREEPLIRKHMNGDHIKLDGKTIGGLNLYINSKVEELNREHTNLDEALVNSLKKRLHDKAKGMFLWVRLVVAMLIQKGSVAEIEDAIDQLPDGLGEAYRRVLDRIEQLDSYLRHRVFKIFYWACVAQRPVTVFEVADGIALHAGQAHLNKRTRIINVDRDIVDKCAPLLEKSPTGVIDLVHFSAKEYLLHEQSGPFIDQVQAHLAIAMSCCINMTACLDLVPNYLDVDEITLEKRAVQGYYGLFGYGNDFWVEHVVHYFAGVDNLDSEGTSLISRLKGFSRVCKHPCETLDHIAPEKNSGRVRLALEKLHPFPNAYDVVVRYLSFRLKTKETQLKFDTTDEQQQFLLQADETYLTLIGCRLDEITQRLLAMDAAQLPPHINQDDYKYFTSRFRLPCRYIHCNNSYVSVEDRDDHEMTHVSPTFPCQLCDFSIRGFRSRKDLDRHIRTYHTNPEDIEIPSKLRIGSDGFKGVSGFNFRRSSMPISPSKRWNEQGRRAMQGGFQQVLKNFEAAVTSTSGKNGDSMTTPSESLVDLDTVKDKINKEQYDNLADFKIDLRQLLSVYESRELVTDEIDVICCKGFEKVASKFPTFASIDSSSSKRNALAGAQNEKPSIFSFQAANDTQNGTSNLSDRFSKTYWSLAEENEFPALLRRCGRDFMRIADYFQTKTIEDVDDHFGQLLRSGRTDLQRLADLADAELAEKSHGGSFAQDTKKDTECQEVTHHNPDMTARPEQQPYVVDPALSYYTAEPDMVPADGNSRRSSNTKIPPNSIEPIIATEGSTVRKRRPRPRALCQYCNNEFHDEYAAQKHYRRIHTPVRKAWICNDISDGSFLSGCKPCSVNKIYGLKIYATRHLQRMHFSVHTSAQTLSRWIREVEQPNPKYKKPSVESSPPPADGSKRRKLDVSAHELPQVSILLNESDFLPRMNLRPPTGSNAGSNLPVMLNSSDDAEDEQEKSDNPSEGGPEPTSDDFLLPKVSFDNILPSGMQNVNEIKREGLPHRSNPALIQPDQVDRIPHLEPFRKTVCRDQVEALHQRLDLDGASLDIKEYQADMKKLVSLSRKLMKDLNHWRRQSSRAPAIPLSL